MICRHSSEPIEPPAPVTMTTRSRMQASNKPGLGRHRIAAQEIATHRPRECRQRSPCRSPAARIPAPSARARPAARAALKISRRRRRVNDGRASRIRSMLAILDQFRQVDPARYTLMPLTIRPCRLLLSSMNTSGSNARVVDRHGRQSARRPRRRRKWPRGPRSAECSGSAGSSAPRSASRRRTAARGTNRSPPRSRTAPGMSNAMPKTPSSTPLSSDGKGDGEHGLVAEKADDRAIQAQSHEDREC